MATFVFIKNADEDRWRIKVRNAKALDWPRDSEFAERLS